MIKYLIFLLLPFAGSPIAAQEYCRRQLNNALSSTAEDDFNNYVFTFKAAGKHLNTDIKTIPVVIHIIYDNPADSLPLAQVQSQITATNLDLRRQNADTIKTRAEFRPAAADMHIEICLAAKTPDGQPTPGVVWHHIPGFDGDFAAVMAQNEWDPQRYLNVWTDPGVPGGASTFAWQAGETGDGIIIGSKVLGTIGDLNPGQEGGGVFTHELGHYLGLYHTFHGGFQYLGNCNFPPCDSTCDRVCDTPLDWDLPFSAELCDPGFRLCDDGTSYYVQNENFMAYSNDTCTNMFTIDQRIRMRAALDSLRAALCSPANLALAGCIGAVPVHSPVFEKQYFTVFPNPAAGTLNIRHTFSDASALLINDALGKPVARFTGIRNSHEIALDHLPGGVYFLYLLAENQILRTTLIKQ